MTHGGERSAHEARRGRVGGSGPVTVRRRPCVVFSFYAQFCVACFAPDSESFEPITLEKSSERD